MERSPCPPWHPPGAKRDNPVSLSPYNPLSLFPVRLNGKVNGSARARARPPVQQPDPDRTGPDRDRRRAEAEAAVHQLRALIDTQRRGPRSIERPRKVGDFRRLGETEEA